jgi:hypothetical protein
MNSDTPEYKRRFWISRKRREIIPSYSKDIRNKRRHHHALT